MSHERKDLDFVLEIHVEGDARKDFEDNVAALFAPRHRRVLRVDVSRAWLAGFPGL